MMISHRSFLKYSAAAGAAALNLAFPLAARAETADQENGGQGGVEILQSTAEDGYLRVTLNTVSRSVYRDKEPACLVLLGFTVTNLTGEPVWIYHVHSNAFGQYEDGSQTIGGSFGGEAFQAQITRSEKMAQTTQAAADGDGQYVFYGVNPGQTIDVGATGTISSGAGTLTLTFTPPEQPGPNAGVHDSTHTFTVKFGQACGPDDLQMAYQ